MFIQALHEIRARKRWKREVGKSPLLDREAVDLEVRPPRSLGARSVNAETEATTVAHLLTLDPTQFELWVATLLRDSGYRDVQRLGGKGDLAADITCRDQLGGKIVVQCKRYKPEYPVRSPEMQLFIGMVNVAHRAEGGIFVTTSAFTADAARLARSCGIRLIDGPALEQLTERLHSRLRRS